MSKKTISVRLEEEVYEKLKDLAKTNMRSVSAQTAMILRNELEKQEQDNTHPENESNL